MCDFSKKQPFESFAKFSISYQDVSSFLIKFQNFCPKHFLVTLYNI